MRRFLGVRRRQEVRGVARGVTVVDDFAHHPTAIRETILALKGRFGPGKLIAAFEPRSATSRRNVFQNEFADALSVADEVVLAPLYAPEKVPEGERLDVEQLAADLRREDVPARVIPTVEATVAHLAERASPGDTVLVMSSGDYGGLHDRLLLALGDPVMPARLEHKVRIGNLLDRVGIAHPVLEQFWPAYLVIPGDDADGAAGRLRGDRARRRGGALAHAGGRARAARRGARLRAGRGGDRAGARLRRRASSTWSPTARRATSARSSASRRSIARTSRRRSPPPPSTRWPDRRTPPGCERISNERWPHPPLPDSPPRDPLEGARKIAAEIARDAGKILMEGLGTRPTVGYKSEDINLVTEYDKRSEALIVERLAAAFPADRIVAEEGTNAAGEAGATRVWYVDPLDGTTNFAHGMPIFSVSIGLCINRRPVLGIVEAPALGWSFAGTISGGGSTLNGKPIAPSRVDRLGAALLVTGFPYTRNPVQTNLPEWTAFTRRRRGPGGSARRRSISASSPPAGSTATGSGRCTPGIWWRAPRLSTARAGRPPISTGPRSTARPGGCWPATARCTIR